PMSSYFGVIASHTALAPRNVRPWHRVPREAVAAPSLEVPKARLDRAWSTLDSGRCPAHGRRCSEIGFKVFSSPNHPLIALPVPCWSCLCFGRSRVQPGQWEKQDNIQ
ncbi:unnamed protein product, partial [Coccothraustes coccothraustes]